jgi:hypothetical protein
MIQPDEPVVLPDPGLNGTPSMSNVDLTTFAGDAVMPGVYKPMSSLMDQRKMATFLCRRPTGLMLPNQHPVDAVEG